MLNKSGLFAVSDMDAERILEDGARNDWRIFRLPAGIATKEEFFGRVGDVLPLDPVLQGNHSWDALEDSLWAGLDALQELKIIIVWPNSARMKMSAPEDFSIACDIFSGLSASLADKDVTAGEVRKLLVLRVD
jgi:hypothetical protein